MERYRKSRTIRGVLSHPIVLSLSIVASVLGPIWAGARAQDAAEELRFANGLFRQRRYDLAAEEYKKFLDANAKSSAPEVAGATYAMATCKLFLGQYAEARQAFDDFLLLAPDNPNAASARFRVGETSYFLGDVERAAKALNQFLAESPKDHPQRDSALVYAGDLSLRQEKADTAAEFYRKSIADFPEGRLVTRAMFGLGRAYSLQNQHDKALEQFLKLKATGSKDWTERASYHIALEWIASKKTDEAAEAVDALEKAAPNGAMAADAKLKLAELLLARGLEAKAIPVLKSFEKVEPPSGAAIQAIGRLAGIYLDKKQGEQALAILEPMIARIEGQAASASLIHQAADAQLLIGQKAKAQTLYERLATSFPTDIWADDARLRAAELAADAKDFRKARSLLAGMPVDPKEAAWADDAKLLIARLDLAEGQPEKAAEALKSLIEVTKRADVKSSANYQLALAYKAMGQAEKARTVLGELTSTTMPEADADPLLLLAQSDFESKKYAEAIGSLTRYLDQDSPRLADHALAWLAISQWETGKVAEAAATLSRLQRSSPNSPTIVPTLLRLGESANLAGKPETAVPWLEDAAKLSTDKGLRSRAYSELGHAYAASKRTDESAAAFAKAAENADGDLEAGNDAALAAAKVLTIGGRETEALARLDSILASGGTVAPNILKEARLNRARLLARIKRHDEAAKAYDDYAKAYFDNAARGSEKDAGGEAILAEWAYALLDAGQTEKADEVFRRIVDRFPRTPKADEARVNLAESAYGRKSYEEAAASLADLVGATKPEGLADTLREAALYRSARCEIERKQWAAAETFWARLIAEFPASPLALEARFWQSEIALRTDRPADALQILEGLLKEDTKSGDTTPAWFMTARLRRVQALVALKRWDDLLTVTDSTESRRLEAQSGEFKAEMAYARGRAYQSTARFDEARNAYQEAIDAKPPVELAAKAQFMRGETWFHQKNYREALREFLKVDILHESPTWQAAALLEAAKVYERLNQTPDAADLYERLVERFPNEAAATEARSRLRTVKPTASRAESPTGR